MAKYFKKELWRRRALAVCTVALSAGIALGAMAACADTSSSSDEDEEESVSRTDTQLIRNGNFEFYEEMDVEELDEKRDLINSPDNWTFTAGSPSSDAASGIVNAAEWNYLSTQGREFTSIDDAVAHWNDETVTLYDRLQFYDAFEDEIDDLDDESAAAELFADYQYSIDFDDVKNLGEIEGGLTLHGDSAAADDEEEDETPETSVLMIHNERDDNNARGTGQYYTSGTTITLEAGTAAEVSVWVKTSNLYHYYADNDTPVTKRAGAYIGVTNTVGGETLTQMQIENINTKDVTENNGWKQYTVYVRANTFAATTFKIVLGLGKSSSTDRYHAVDGYAFFDDLTCKIISDEAYAQATGSLSDTVKCAIDTPSDGKVFDATDLAAESAFALDLSAEFDGLALDADNISFGLTEEVSGSLTFASKIESNIGDANVAENKQSVTALMTYAQLKATNNLYLRPIVEKDFAGYPFVSGDATDDDAQMLLLMSTNGAAYTAALSSPAFTLEPDARIMVSFRVKTSEIRTGKSGAGITLVDGENRTSIDPFDSTTVATVDIDDETKDIYDGWVQCFFFVTNETDTQKTFTLEFTFGPTDVATAALGAYGDGYAAFTDFKTREMTKADMNYASSGTYSQVVTLTGAVDNDSKFDDASVTSDIESGLAVPANFEGVLAGSDVMVENGTPNKLPDGVYTGLLNASSAAEYMALDAAQTPWKGALDAIAGGASDGETWWRNIFGGAGENRVANQPLVLVNTAAEAAPSYGFLAGSTSLAADSYRRISVRVKLSAGATATVYLIDTSDVKAGFTTSLAPTLPKVTYWYDDEGNIVNGDPTDKDFSPREDTLFYLEENGLYTRAGADDGKYYANLHNYETDDAGNLVTDDGTIAYYCHDGKYYAYRTETAPETYSYSQVVETLPTELDGTSIVRYTAPANSDAYRTAITVTGTAENAGRWTEVSFYLHTGNRAKEYRLEVWAGARDNAADGIPAGGYVFFDDYSSESVTTYDALLSEAVDELKQTADNLVDADDFSSNLKDTLALYYTFTFYDSVSYLRYDASTDEEALGDPYGSYEQSAYAEQIAWLRYDDTKGAQTGAPAHSIFIDYTATDVTVEADQLTSDDSDDEETTEPAGDVNVAMIISSGILAAVLIVAIVVIGARRFGKLQKKKKKAAPVNKTHGRPAPKPIVKAAPPEEAPKDENDPYNE